MKFINKMEKKFGRYAIHNLMYYIIILSVLGIVLNAINPTFMGYLTISPTKIFEGQVWRIFTWIIVPSYGIQGTGLIFTAIELYLYYFIGKSLEDAWGSFRFNLYYFSGILLNVLAVCLVQFVLYRGSNLDGYWNVLGLQYINHSLFLAFATLYPNMQLMFMFIIPLKIKYLAYFYAAQIAYEILRNIIDGNLGFALLILTAIANFLIFFMSSKNFKKLSPKERKRKAKYRKHIHLVEGSTRHKCSVCGKTELDGEELEFRFCSKCEGNYEYCMEHLFSHEHIHKH